MLVFLELRLGGQHKKELEEDVMLAGFLPFCNAVNNRVEAKEEFRFDDCRFAFPNERASMEFEIRRLRLLTMGYSRGYARFIHYEPTTRSFVAGPAPKAPPSTVIATAESTSASDGMTVYDYYQQMIRVAADRSTGPANTPPSSVEAAVVAVRADAIAPTNGVAVDMDDAVQTTTHANLEVPTTVLLTTATAIIASEVTASTTGAERKGGLETLITAGRSGLVGESGPAPAPKMPVDDGSSMFKLQEQRRLLQTQLDDRAADVALQQQLAASVLEAHANVWASLGVCGCCAQSPGAGIGSRLCRSIAKQTTIQF
jgi:hypothetical protein